MSKHACFYCGPTGQELRPYGPGGATICFPCMTATPEREQAAWAAFGVQLEMVQSLGVGLIGTEAGPINVDVGDLQALAGLPMPQVEVCGDQIIVGPGLASWVAQQQDDSTGVDR